MDTAQCTLVVAVQSSRRRRCCSFVDAGEELRVQDEPVSEVAEDVLYELKSRNIRVILPTLLDGSLEEFRRTGFCGQK